MNRSVAMQPARPTGTLIRKIQCQDAVSTSQPPSVGPMSGPTKPGMVTKPMACKNWSRGNVRSTTKRPTGSSKAPPKPWSTRAATSRSRRGDKAHKTEPSTKALMAPR